MVVSGNAVNEDHRHSAAKPHHRSKEPSLADCQPTLLQRPSLGRRRRRLGMGAGRGTETHDENARERSHTRSQRPDRRLSAAPTYRTSCGANRDRTGDLLNAIQALSQLSYSPVQQSKVESSKSKARACALISRSNIV